MSRHIRNNVYAQQHVIAHVTGNLNPAKQAAWLDAHGWKYTLGEDGEILVYTLEVDRQLQSQRERLALEAGERGDAVLLSFFDRTGKPVPTSVYLVGAVGHEMPIKIGYSSNLKLRMRDLQIGSPIKLEVAAHYEAEDRVIAQRIENRIHTQFRQHRSHGEWFNVSTAEVVDWIDATFANDLVPVFERR